MMLRPAALVLALAASAFAWGEALEPPERVAHLAYVEGQVAFRGAQMPPTSSLPDRPLTPGDHLVTEGGGRAELALGTAVVRLDERTELSIVDLDATAVRVELSSGTASVYLRDLVESETFEIVTPNTAIALDAPGEYRVEVPAGDFTLLTVHRGAAFVTTAGGPVRVADGQRVRLEGRDAFASLVAPQPADPFDDWALEREVQLAEAEPSRYGSRDDVRYDELDRYGVWYDEPRYGRVWMPSYGQAGWAPYRYGRWERFGIGWSWIDPAPWGFFTFHHGRWAFLHHLNRWCWVPERRIHTRQFAHDTAPFGRPRGDARSRDIREDAPRTARWRTNGDGVRRPVATADVNSRRVDADRRPELRRDAASGERPRGTTLVRSVNRDQSPPRRVTAAPQRGEATMRSSRTSAARTQAASGAELRTGRALGTRYIR